MKTKFTFLALLTIAFFSAQAQVIPNAGFETWTSPLNPDGWSTYSSAFGFNLGLCGRDSVDRVVGLSSAKVYADSVPGQPAYGVVAGALATGSASAGAQGPQFNGIAFAFRPDTLYFAYKYVSPGNDTANLILGMRKNGATVFINNYNALRIPLDTTSQWGLAYVPLTTLYANSTITPDTLLVLFEAANFQVTKGSTLNVDQLFFSQSVVVPNSIDDVAANVQVSIYPNPASSELNIKAENLNGAQVIITDLNGSIVRIRPLTADVTTVDLSEVASGTYIYRIADKTGRFVKQDRFNIVK
ncbi:MAG TPA: T9SS type A sorting domain-containing protein [Chitinophagales bacterium]|nr:T9SS type A sorting domain-containing protein [Chitinophagales bacterium]